MSFAAPLFLLAVLAGLIPVAVHLIHRQRAKEIRFSTLRFLKLSVQRTRRRKYLEDLSLLALRAAVLVLIAIGLARPAINSVSALWGSGRAAAVAIVLDNSASMGTIDGGRPRFETAREAAEQVLAGLREGDQAALLLTGGPPAPEVGKLFRTLETVRQALDQCRVSAERADLAARLQQARDLLSQADSANREIYIVTDNQGLSWDGLKEGGSTGQAAAGTTPAIPVVLVGVDREPAPNVALQSIRLDTPAPVAGAPFLAEVDVRNTSIVPQQKHLELQVDGARRAVSPTLSLPPGGSVKHLFRFTMDRGGVHRGEVRLVEDDGLPPDNRLFFAAGVDQQVPVAILKSRRDEIPQADDAFYLERALASGGPLGTAFRMTTLTPDALAADDLSGQAVIFAVNLPALAPPAAERLLAYVRRGGHVFWVCGQNTQPVACNAMNALAQGQLLPAPLEELRQPLPGGIESWRLGFLDRDDPALAALTEPASLYQSVLVTRHFPMTLTPQSGALARIKLDDGQVLLAERGVGAGSVLLLGTALHADWTNLPLKPLFLPLLARLTFRLAGAEGERTMVTAGTPVTLPLRRSKAAGAVPDPDPDGGVELVRPSGEVVRLANAVDADGLFHDAETHEPGIYLVRTTSRAGTKALSFAVNIDPAESDPAVATPQELRARFGTQPLLICERPEDLAGTVSRLREGTSLRDAFLIAVLVGLVLEVFLANRHRPPPEQAAGPMQRAAPAAGEAGSPGDRVHSFLEDLENATAAREGAAD